MPEVNLQSVHTVSNDESPINGWFVTRLAILGAAFMSLAPFIVEFTRG